MYVTSGVTRVGDTRGGNWGCHPSIFPWKTWRPFFAHRCHYHYRFLLLSLGCHPLQGVTPHLFPPDRPGFSTILCKFAHKIFSFGCHPLEGVTRGGPPPPLVTPLYVTQSWQSFTCYELVLTAYLLYIYGLLYLNAVVCIWGSCS